MFTGIVETVGKVAEVESRGETQRLVIEAPAVCPGVRVGDSISVSGACLTVARVDPGSGVLAFDAVRETLDRTSLGRLERGGRVNLERALRADARLDGHIVQGHVDACGQVLELRRRGEDVQLFIECGASFAGLQVEKGSVAIDGVSLTVVGVEATAFDVALIPHTLEVTTLGDRRPGDPVNLEADVLGKYVQRHLERIFANRGSDAGS
jgi:riboflavin synthase